MHGLGKTVRKKSVNAKSIIWCVLAGTGFIASALAQTPAPTGAPGGEGGMPGKGSPSGPVVGDLFRTQYIRLGSNTAEGLLYEPTHPGAHARIGLVYSHPESNNFNSPIGRELSSRGYRVLMVNYRGVDTGPESFAPSISRGIEYVRNLAGVQKVLVIGHSGGGHLLSFYENVAEHGAAACQDKQKIYPCEGKHLNDLAKPDGIVFLDAALGAVHRMSSLDPAANDKDRKRDPALDMFEPANGYDVAAKHASYSADFAKRFYAAQAARNARILQRALENLHALEQGTAQFTDDVPFTIAGMSTTQAGARLYQPDISILAHTKSPHMLLKADGSKPVGIVPSVRPPSGMQYAAALGSLNVMSDNTTVRRFLAADAIRTTPAYAFTADDILGVEWTSSMGSAPGNAEGITVPALVMVMTCHYLVVPGEIIFDHLASKDKTFVGVEGAVHEFTPCKPEYGDTVKRLFDYVDSWLSQPGRFN
jgi:pimeloyl-ACP methyl ester carboxylesterase